MLHFLSQACLLVYLFIGKPIIRFCNWFGRVGDCFFFFFLVFRSSFSWQSNMVDFICGDCWEKYFGRLA